MKGLFQCPPRAAPWVQWQSERRPVRAKALYIVRYFKAFALTGRQVCVRNNPGRCPGLRASAPSGRVGKNLRNFNSLILDKTKKS